MLASVAYFRGNFAESLQLVEGLYGSAVRRNDRRVQAEALRWKGHSLLALGKLQELQTCVNELQKLRTAGTSGDVFNQTDVFALLAALHTRRGEKQKALDAIEEAARRAVKMPNSSSEMILERATIAETYLRLWEMHGAESKSPAGVPDNATVVRSLPSGSKQSLQGARQPLARFSNRSAVHLAVVRPVQPSARQLCQSECGLDKKFGSREGIADVVCRRPRRVRTRAAFAKS